MKEWHIKSLNEIVLEDKPCPRGDGEVKLRLSKIALSSTDMSYFVEQNDNMSVPGHSAIAHVSEADEDSGLKLGSRVVISPFLKVREHGIDTIKTMGVDVDGLLRDFVSVPLENVFALPDGVSDDEAIFAEYIAVGNQVFDAVDNEKGDYIVIVGASTLGLMLGQLAVYYQTIPILIDFDEEKLELAKKWGVCYTLNPTYDNLERRVEQITGGHMADAAVFAGEGVGVDAATRLVKSEGCVIIAGYMAPGKHQIEINTILKKQLQVKGVCNGYDEMSAAINLLANKIVKTDGLISVQANFDEVPQVVQNCVKYPYQYNKIIINND